MEITTSKEEWITTSIHIPKQFYNRLKIDAGKEYRSLSREVTKILAEHFKKKEKNIGGGR